MDTDQIKPSAEDKNNMISKSWFIWNSLVENASSRISFPKQIPLSQSILQNVPDFRSTKLLSSLSPGHTNLVASGRSVWRIGSNCELVHKIIDHSIITAISKTVSCTTKDSGGFESWIGIEGKESTDRNYLAILISAWAYIISAHWAESQEGHLQYTDKRGSVSPIILDPNYIIDIGNADEAETKWWTAVAAQNGWKATISSNFEGVNGTFVSPWSIDIDFEPTLTVCSTSIPSPVESSCATASEAYSHLVRFCKLHGIFDQALIALSATLTFPTHSFKNFPAKLPTPKHTRIPSNKYDSTTDTDFRALEKIYRAIGCYMTISALGIVPLLCSMFFEETVPCNLSGEWLETAFQALRPIQHHNLHLAIVGSLRRPSLGFWWTGACLTGLAEMILRSDLEQIYMPIDLVCGWWTGNPQSFICCHHTTTASTSEKWIFRWKEALLLYISGERQLPLCPWRPPGKSLVRDTELSVQGHAYCIDHFLRMESWIWFGADGNTHIDYGYSINPEKNSDKQISYKANSSSKLPDQIEISNKASRQYTLWIFEWLAGSTDRSISPRDTQLYQDIRDWAADIYPDDCGDSDEEIQIDVEDQTSGPSQEQSQAIQRWLMSEELKF
ncbi:MAG: hypothetical protein M1834_004236 [Cirrosporium novae-zelandiae]|nr:MAG: hypothetical protein M1834_004236 [Cirrosporium novae-zelandiae]